MRLRSMCLISFLAFSFLALMGGAGRAGAQESIATLKPTPEQAARCAKIPGEARRKFCLLAYSVPGLEFPARAETARSAFLRMAIFKPEGPGPFPAVILLHSCASLIESENMAYWGNELLKAGYVVFIVDSWRQRGFDNGVCAPTPRMPVNAVYLRLRDAYEALEHLAKFDFVDKKRIGAIGASQGGRVIYQAASSGLARVHAPSGARFAALVSLYGECYNRSLKQDYVPPNAATPLLALFGDRDEDGDPRECLPRLEKLKAAGSPVEWHVFRNVGHVWDEPRFSKRRYVDYVGAPSGRVLFEYDERATAESRTRILDFFAARMPRG